MKKRIHLFIFFFAALILTAHSQVFTTEHKKDGINLKNVVNTFSQRIKLTGYAQFGYNYDAACKAEQNSFYTNRIILMADGKITDNWQAYFMYDLKGNKPLELWSEYKIAPFFAVRIGQFKNPLTLENQISPSSLEFSNNSLVGNYFAAITSSDKLIGGQGGRDAGLMISGQILPSKSSSKLEYKLAVMNGNGINQADNNSQKDLIAALSYKPCSAAELYGSIEEGRGNVVEVSKYNTLKLKENYRRARWSLGAEVKTPICNFRSEYIAGHDGGASSEGYYGTATLHLTERLDLIGSYENLDRNKDMGGAAEETNYLGGVQYWFYPRCRLSVNYTYIDSHKDLNVHSGNQINAQVQFRF